MLVEINMLPKKEPKKVGFLIALACLLALFLLAGAVYLWQINSTKNEITTIDRQINMTKKIVDKEDVNSKVVASTNSVSQLKKAINWANDYPIETIPVMRKLTSLLPERGFIQKFGYTGAGTLTLTVQFDSAREAAYFLDNLNESKWIKDASLSSLSASATTDSTVTSSSADSNGQTNTNSQSVDSNVQTNTPNSTATVMNQDSTGSNSTADSQTNGTIVDQNGTTSSMKGTTTGTNTVINSSNSITTSNGTTSKTTNTNILPRYIGQFEITLNKDETKKMMKASKKDGKGVTGS